MNKILFDIAEQQRAQLAFFAQQGALLMDIRHPTWFEEINLQTFDIGSPARCILAQVYGSYEVGRRITMPQWRAEDIARHGFTVLLDGSVTGNLALDISMLNEAWVREIETRRRKSGS